MSRQYFYKLISNAADLKALHDEAKLHGKLEVGLSKGKLLYAWDEDRNNIRSISQEEAAQRLGVTVSVIDQIIATNAAVVLEEPQAITEEVEKEVVFQEEDIPVVEQTEQTEPDEDPVEESEETKAEEEPTPGQPVTDPIDEPSVLEEVNAPESIQEDQETQPKEVKDVNGPILALVGEIIAALEKFKNDISN